MVFLEDSLGMFLISMKFEPWLLDSIGSLAAICTTVSLFPQLLRVWRRKSARDISFAMFIIFGMGILSWFIYGVAVRSWPMILGNGVTFALAVCILVLRAKYDRRPDGETAARPVEPPAVMSSKIGV